MRIVSWNIESLASRIADVSRLIEQLDHPDVLCFQEARVRASDTELIETMLGAAPGYVCHYSLNRDLRNATFRGGRAHGVITYVSERLKPSRMEVPAWDLEGRLVASHCSDLTIGNVYAVNGTSKPYFDHESGRFSGDRHAFKRHFQKRVFEWAQTQKHLLLAGDWNVSRAKLDTYPRLRTEEPHARAREEFNALLARSMLVDAYRLQHPVERGYSWFNPRARGKRLHAARVDFILVSRDLLPRVRRTAILDDPGLRLTTDHAPVVLELDDQ
jgi:exodeoxyribonuclease III